MLHRHSLLGGMEVCHEIQYMHLLHAVNLNAVTRWPIKPATHLRFRGVCVCTSGASGVVRNSVRGQGWVWGSCWCTWGCCQPCRAPPSPLWPTHEVSPHLPDQKIGHRNRPEGQTSTPPRPQHAPVVCCKGHGSSGGVHTRGGPPVENSTGAKSRNRSASANPAARRAARLRQGGTMP